MLSFVQLGSLPALVAAAVALGEGNGENDDTEDRELRAATGVVIAFAALAILLEMSVIILRFCNVGLVNIKIEIFLVTVSSIMYGQWWAL